MTHLGLDNRKEQAEAEVVPSSSLVELEVEVGVRVVWFEVGLGSRCSSVFLLFRSGGWVGGRRNGDLS